MRSVVHARLDEETSDLLARLRRRLIQTDSEIIRRAIRTMATLELRSGGTSIVGLGAFEAGVPDLGSNKKHLKGFGRR